MGNKLRYSFETYAVSGARKGDKSTGAISYPLYLSATFKHNGLNESTGYDYSRLQNPTREEAEKTIALLENGKEALAFSCGMAALTACVHLFKSGDHVILSEDLYGGTFRLFDEVYSVYNIEASFIDTSDINKVKDAIRSNTRGIIIETPSNPLMRVTDIKAISDICKAKNIISIVDNTFLTPYYQRPLELGADIVVHSGTKYLGGHNDVLAGFAISNNEEIIEKLDKIAKTFVVRGNNDGDSFGKKLPDYREIEMNEVLIYVLHNIDYLPNNLREVDLVIYGHSHKYNEEKKDNIIYLNPGACGRKRFSLPLTMAIVDINDESDIKITKIDLE